MRDRLIELIKNAPVWKNGTFDEACEFVADHLIENGVIVPPCKVGDIVHHVTEYRGVVEARVRTVFYDKNGKGMIRTTRYDVPFENVGKTLFIGEISKTEAEKALRGEGE